MPYSSIKWANIVFNILKKTYETLLKIFYVLDITNFSDKESTRIIIFTQRWVNIKKKTHLE